MPNHRGHHAEVLFFGCLGKQSFAQPHLKTVECISRGAGRGQRVQQATGRCALQATWLTCPSGFMTAPTPLPSSRTLRFDPSKDPIQRRRQAEEKQPGPLRARVGDKPEAGFFAAHPKKRGHPARAIRGEDDSRVGPWHRRHAVGTILAMEDVPSIWPVASVRGLDCRGMASKAVLTICGCNLTNQTYFADVVPRR